MGDLGEYYRARKEQHDSKKLSNVESSTKMLDDNHIGYHSNNGGIHLVVEHRGLIADFWPSTGKFKLRTEIHHGRGVKNLIYKMTEGNKNVGMD